MRTIAHLSDLHFGTEDPRLVQGVLADLGELNPEVVAISGDLTQRARSREFAHAAGFLARIKPAILVVPGNHDVPLYNPIGRFLRPLAGYRRFITDNLMPSWVDEEIALLGLNTARSNTWKNGRISRAQMRGLRSIFCETSPHLFKILVIHHPFVPPPAAPSWPLVGRGMPALQVAEECGVDLVLAGHFHLGYSADVRIHYLKIRRSILVIQAGTAVSCRTRGEPNAYNAIRIDPPSLAITVRAWNGARFAPLSTTRYVKRQEEWCLE
jgi:3',5'-cyclic AMP phosphodiesterase CpdA